MTAKSAFAHFYPRVDYWLTVRSDAQTQEETKDLQQKLVDAIRGHYFETAAAFREATASDYQRLTEVERFPSLILVL